MKNVQMLYGMAIVFVIVLSIVGCNLVDKDAAPPTLPESSIADATPLDAGPIANFYVSAGTADSFGVYLGESHFVVNIPKKGTYALTYYTKTGGPYVFVVQVKKNSLLYVGLMPGDEIWDATINEGDATALAATTPDAQNFGSLIVVFRPGFIGNWMDYIVVNISIPQIILIQGGTIVISDNVKSLSTVKVHPPKTKPKTKPKTQPVIIVTTEPEIDVQGNGVSIVAGDTTPNVADDTDFGTTSVTIGPAVMHTFTVINTGTTPLVLGTATVSDTTNYTITQPITVGTVATFTVEFNPIGSAAGTFPATVSLPNNDSDENPYDFAITGIGQ